MLRNNKFLFFFCFLMLVSFAITLSGCKSDEKLVYVQATGNTSDALLKHSLKVVAGQDAVLNTSSFAMIIPANNYEANTEIIIVEDINYSTLDNYFSSRFSPQSSLLNITITEPSVASMRSSFLGGLLGATVSKHNYMTIGDGKISVRLTNSSSYNSNNKYFMACRTRINGNTKWVYNETKYENGVFVSYFNTKYDGFMLVKLKENEKATLTDGFDFFGPESVSAGYVGTFSQDVEFSLGFKLDINSSETFSSDKLDISFVSLDKIATPSIAFENLSTGSPEAYQLPMQGSNGYYYTLPAKLANFASYDIANGNASYTFKLKIKDVSVDNFPGKMLMIASYKLYDNEEYTAEKLVEFRREGSPEVYPEVISVYPEDGLIYLASDVNNKVTVKFKEAMDANTLSGCLTIQEKDNPATSAACEFVSLSDDGLIATFPFTFTSGKEYTATITDAENTYGHALLASFTWSFKIVDYSGIDSVTVSKSDGSNINAVNAANVATNTSFVVAYQKAIEDTSEVNIVIKQNGLDVALGSIVWETDNKTVTVTPVSAFNYDSSVEITITGGKDEDGYNVNDFSCNLTIVSQNSIVTRSPINSATSVSVNEPILITFSGSMSDSAINCFSMKRKLTNENVFTNFTDINKSFENNNTVLRIVPTSGKWDYNSSYQLIISNTPLDGDNNNIIVDLENSGFATEIGNAPVISAANISNITRYSSKVSFSMTVTDGKPVQADSVSLEVVKYSEAFTNENIATYPAILSGNAVTANITDLERSTVYKFRACYKVSDDNTNYLHNFSNNFFATAKWDGAGTESSPYQISSAEELIDIAGDEQGGYYFKQTANIDLVSVDNWTPLGNTSSTAFKGTYDGNSKTISNLTITTNGSSNLGLFAYVQNANLKNINLNNVTINESNLGTAIGALVGYVGSSQISNCNVSGVSINGGSLIGGLVGDAYGTTFTSCNISGNVTINGNSTTNTMVGGFAGRIGNSSLITNCVVNGSGANINISGFSQVGGFVGLMNDVNSTYSNCTVSTNVVVKHEQVVTDTIQYFGCFAGVMKGGSLVNPLVEGIYLEADNHSGGIVGMINSAATGEISNATISGVTVKSRKSGSESNTGIIFGVNSSEIIPSDCHVTSASQVTAYTTTTDYVDQSVP